MTVPSSWATGPTASGPRSHLLLYAKLVAVAMLWGGTFIAGRILAQAMPLAVAAFGRFAIAVALLLVVALKVEGGLPRLDRRQMLLTAALGFFGIFLYNICFFAALSRIPAGRTALFVSLNPIATAVAANLIFKERLGPARWVGIALALVGATIVITRGDPIAAIQDISGSLGAGEAMMIVAVLSWAAYTLVSRVALSLLTPVAATTYGAIWGLLFLSFGAVADFSAVRWTELGWLVWTSIVYLGAFGTVIAFVWYYQGIHAIGPSRTAVFNNLVPIFGVMLSALILEERILISMVLGGLLSTLGVTITNRARRS